MHCSRLLFACLLMIAAQEAFAGNFKIENLCDQDLPFTVETERGPLKILARKNSKTKLIEVGNKVLALRFSHSNKSYFFDNKHKLKETQNNYFNIRINGNNKDQLEYSHNFSATRSPWRILNEETSFIINNQTDDDLSFEVFIGEMPIKIDITKRTSSAPLPTQQRELRKIVILFNKKTHKYKSKITLSNKTNFITITRSANREHETFEYIHNFEAIEMKTKMRFCQFFDQNKYSEFYGLTPPVTDSDSDDTL